MSVLQCCGPPVLELESQELELFAAPEPECIQDPAPVPELGPESRIRCRSDNFWATILLLTFKKQDFVNIFH
jgi:hypothetical protein